MASFSVSQPNTYERWRKVYPDASEEELRQADENMRRYFAVAWRICLRLHREGRLDQVLTNARKSSTIQLKLNPPKD
jgi:hypothetical protein